jgi:hypothetical protein
LQKESELEESAEDKKEIDFNDIVSLPKYKDEEPTEQLRKILLSLDGKYKFRSIAGIAKELSYPVNVV